MLRVFAAETYSHDRSGWTCAQLLDLADLLESAEKFGWFG
jgi:hypothetical protein